MSKQILPFVLLLAAAGGALAQERETLAVPAGSYSVKDLVQRWAASRSLLVSVDRALEGAQLDFARDTKLDLPTLRAALDARDAVLLKGGGDTLQVVHRRNLSERVSPPFPMVDPARIPDSDQVVTAVFPIHHGGGARIFAVLRGLLSRDVNRIGNVFYEEGSEAVMVVDLAWKVRYYQQVIARLDTPPAVSGLELRLYELPRARWNQLRTDHRGEGLLNALTQAQAEGQATQLESADLNLRQDHFSLGRLVALPLAGSVQVQVDLVHRDGDDTTRDALDLSLALELNGKQGRERRSVQLSLPAQLPGDGVWVQAVAGREKEEPTQFVLLLRATHE